MAAHDPRVRTLVARAAALTRHAHGDTVAATAPARAAFLARFEAEVDPHNELDPTERARRAERARKAYFVRLALKSAQARSKATPA